MASQQIPGFKSLRGIIMATMVAVGSMMTMASTATAVTLKVSIENLSPTNGSVLPPVWVAFHDGSFDTFDVGAPASSGLEYLAEGGITGLESSIPGLLDGYRLANPGFDGTFPGIPADSTLASLFARSSAGMNGGVQSLVFTDYPGNPGQPGIFWPGLTATETITLNGSLASHRYFSYASHIVPSNDAFIGNDDPIEIFDAEGKFIGTDFIVLGNQVLDAGTQVNDEDPSSIQPFSKGIAEHGVVHLHPGLKPRGTGGLLEQKYEGSARFTNADFKAPDYQVARITITEVPESVPEPAPTTGLLALSGLFMLLRQVRPSV